MRTIYHLGLHKTGSTSLQLFLQRNQQQLARAGILFAPVTPQGLVHFNADACSDAPLRTPVLNDYMGHNALAYRMIAEGQPGFVFPPVHTPAHDPMPDAATAFAQIKKHASVTGARALVFCSEDLARASLMVPTVPTRFATHFGTNDVTLVAALRRPDDAIAAWQTQRLRFGTPFAPLHTDPPEAWLGTVHFEYQAALEPWLQAFPNAALRLQSYPQLRAQGGSIDSFGALSQLDLPTGLAPIPDSNSGLPYALLEIARQSLAALPHQSARKFLSYLEGAADRLDLPANTRIELFTPEARRTLHRAFADIHIWLSQTTGNWPFFEDLDEMQSPREMHITQVTEQVLPDLIQDASQHLEDADLLAFLARFRP